MKKSSRSSSRRPCVQDLLSGDIDPQSDSFWESFGRSLEVTDEKSKVEFDRRAIINLKLLLSPQKLTKERIQTLSYLVGKKGLILKDNFTSDIGDLLLEIMIRSDNKFDNQSIEFSSSVRFLLTRNPSLKTSFFNSTIDQFARWLFDESEINHKIISELFLINITLISGANSVRGDFKNHISPMHLSRAVQLMHTCGDSTAQITIAEWIWRAVRLLGGVNKEIAEALGSDISLTSVPKETFRGSLHDFIVSINTSENSSSNILHIYFTCVLVNKKEVKCSGCIDSNSDNVAFFFSEKPQNIPDVAIFRTNFIIGATSSSKSMSFTTRERSNALSPSGVSGNTKYTIIIDKKRSNPSTIKEFVNRLTSRFVDRRGSDLHTTVTPQQTRVVAPKNTPRVDIKASPAESQKSADINDIEQRLDEYASSAKRGIEQAFDTFIHKTEDVIDELSTIQNSLSQLLLQHEETTKCTTRENEALSETVSKLQKEFESRHKDSLSKREAIKNEALRCIEVSKNDIKTRADTAFKENAIIGFTAALDDLPQRLQNMQLAQNA